MWRFITFSRRRSREAVVSVSKTRKLTGKKKLKNGMEYSKMLHSLTLLFEKGERAFSALVRKGSSLELSLSSGLLAPYPKSSGMFSIQALPVPQQLQGNQRGGRRGRWNNVQAVTTQQQQPASQQRQFHSQTYQKSQVQSQPPPQQYSCAPLQLGKKKRSPSSQQHKNQQPHQVAPIASTVQSTRVQQSNWKGQSNGQPIDFFC